MIVAGLLGMATKFTEVTLGVEYRDIDAADRRVAGGPMRYLSKGLAERGWPRMGRALAVFFALCCVGGSLSGGNMFQANPSYQQLLQVTGGHASPLAHRAWLFGSGLALLVGLVIIGGIRSIAAVTARLVPVMAVLYLGAGAVVLAAHADRLPWAVGQILMGAWSAEGVAEGALGALITRGAARQRWPKGVAGDARGALIQGFPRATFSNEAGLGSAAIAHAAVRTDCPIPQGYAALLEPFIDTVVLCTMTALVIIDTGYVDAKGPTPSAGGVLGVALNSAAFGSVMDGFPGLCNLFSVNFRVAGHDVRVTG